MMTTLARDVPPMFADLKGDIRVSFEFFPPKTDAMETTLWESIKTLEPFAPRFVSVTYGAGGSTRDRTHSTVSRLVKETSLTPAAHLTCVNATRTEVDAVARSYWDAGIRHIVALRGDSPVAGERFSVTPGGYESAADLVAGLKKVADFDISVSAYPELHPDAINAASDISYLRSKLAAGASRAITQFFFDADTFLRFRDSVGSNVEIVPGILPVSNFKQTMKMAAQCNTRIPGWMGRLFEGLDDHPASRQLVAATITAEMCRRLYEEGVREFHFYTLNRAELTFAICHMLGLRTQETLRAAA
jgi:methylenetetrahydrofolate reductase (NADPH)